MIFDYIAIGFIIGLKIYAGIGLVIFLTLMGQGKIKNQSWSVVPRGVLWCFLWPWALKHRPEGL